MLISVGCIYLPSTSGWRSISTVAKVSKLCVESWPAMKKEIKSSTRSSISTFSLITDHRKNNKLDYLLGLSSPDIRRIWVRMSFGVCFPSSIAWILSWMHFLPNALAFLIAFLYLAASNGCRYYDILSTIKRIWCPCSYTISIPCILECVFATQFLSSS